MDTTYERITTDVGNGNEDVPTFGNNFLPSAQIAGGGIFQGKSANPNISTSLLLAQNAVHQKTLIQQSPQLDRVLIYGTLAAAIILVLII